MSEGYVYLSYRILFGLDQGRSQDFSKGGHTGSNNIVMTFSPRNIVGCLLKKRLTKGEWGGHGHPRIPLATALWIQTLHRQVFGLHCIRHPNRIRIAYLCKFCICSKVVPFLYQHNVNELHGAKL